MVYGDIIKRADELYPNEYTKDEKLEWIRIVNADVIKNIEKKREAAKKVGENDASIIPLPYEDMYIFYILSQIAYFQRDFDAYNQHISLYSARRDDYMSYYLRTQGGETMQFKNWI